MRSSHPPHPADPCGQRPPALTLLHTLLRTPQIPVINVALPFVWKSFPFIYTADCIALAAVFAWKGLLPGQTQEQQ